MFKFLNRSRSVQILLISLLILLIIQYSSSEGSKINSQSSDIASPHVLPRFYTQANEPLVSLLGNLTFKNYGVVKNTDRYTWQRVPILYLEAQNVSGPYVGWADTKSANYLFHDVAGDMLHPPSGMRSSVPLGGKASSVLTTYQYKVFKLRIKNNAVARVPAGSGRKSILYLCIACRTNASPTHYPKLCYKV